MAHEEPLFAEERLGRIIQVLREEKKVLVPELCDRFQVSPATIRNDLNELESRGLLKRTHGGAIPVSKTGFELGTEEKLDEHAAEKARIAAAAAVLVEDGDSIAVDTGSTALSFARALVSKHGLTVVTNDLKVALLLEETTDASVLVIGGLVRRGFHCMLGELANESMSRLCVDKFFLATNGVTAARGLSTPDLFQAEVKRRFIDAANEVILICDGSKIGRTGLVRFSDLRSVNRMITDAGADPDEIQMIRACGVEVELV